MSTERACDERLLLAELCRDYPYLERECRERGPGLLARLVSVMELARGGGPIAEAARELLNSLDPGGACRGISPEIPGTPPIPQGAMVYVCPLGRCDRIDERRAGRPPQCQVANTPLKHHRVEV
jgi:hypothetical protein